MTNKYFAKAINLRPGEEIIVILRRHPITYAKQITVTAILILFAFFLMFYLLSLGQSGAALFLALFFTGLFYGLREFFIWYFNAEVITNQRLIDMDQKGFLSKIVSEVSYDKILDISYSVKGFWQTILKLGTIKIQASGAALILINIKDVAKVNQLLIDLIKQQTGKELEIKKDYALSAKVKSQLTEDFMKQDELTKYEDYNSAELIEEYKETFGDLKLKKMLVDELDKHEKQDGIQPPAKAINNLTPLSSEEDELKERFKQRRL